LKAGRVPGVTLQWGASTDNVGVTTYWIYRDGQFLTSVSGTALSYVDQAPAGTHGYYVVARDAAGNQSPPSNTATIAV
jgi:chitodextrinase